ncbi:hypothetical protein OKA04_09130 [Luteolibacter flavescens]|uniref:Transporter n=1 Tax=Luteolibacter flavescens TaxID=1859460 RepID=A0ABT3FPH7_9BACT|nr:hypothetical protein [Luteolibacter flavescens]MCW1884890.1 hypothetical protein [Luteolibacter flavescens]
MKAASLFSLTALLCSASAMAGTVITQSATPVTTSGFENARRPISNPTLFDLALPTTNLHPIFMYQRLPDSVSSTAGPLAMGGDVQVYALQFEIALSERLSLVATKDGYVDMNPDNTALWENESGFANIGGGLKYAFIYDPSSSTAVSGTVTFEFPTGNHDVFQGEGDGAANVIVSGLKLWDDLQVAGAAGVHLPFDGQMATTSFISAHASYEVSRWFIPLVEVNWHHLLEAGNGRPNFSAQAGGAVPVVAAFEGYDLLNFGASNATRNRDLVTAAVGFRSRLTDDLQLGFAYELPLTDEENSVMEDRFTLDLVWTF